MNRSFTRREFLADAGRMAGGAMAIAYGARGASAAAEPPKSVPLADVFPAYKGFDPLVPVRCVTPKLAGCFHRFFNTSPISPSGRYLAVTRLAHEDRLSAPDETAEVVLVDLATGETRVVAETKGFDSQLGAQAQWGATDHELFFNDLDTKRWRALGVRVDPLSGERRELDGSIFEVTQDGKFAASICLLRSGITQRGYGVVVPAEVLPWNHGATDDDGVYVTDTTSGECRMVASYKDIVEACGEGALPPVADPGGGYHGHQISWNPQGTRLMLCLAFDYRQPAEQRKTRRCALTLVTLKPDGSDIRVALPCHYWYKQVGNHPCWWVDGEHITMNFGLPGPNRYTLVRLRYDGEGLAPLTSVPGTGHPTLHPDGRHILTDTYQGELPGYEDGTVPLRWIDTTTNTERTLVRIGCRPAYMAPGGALRLDAHPAWDRTYTRVTFNACPNGTRQVFIADIPRELF